MLIFVAAQAPELMSRDLRSHVLPLYMSRPLRRLDYPLAKYAAFTAACLLMLEIPLIILYAGQRPLRRRRVRGLGPDQGADSRNGRRGALGGAARGDRAWCWPR